MTFAEIFAPIAPETTLLIGVCVVFLVGVSRSAAVRAAVAPLTLIIMLAAMGATATCATASGAGPIGLAFDELTVYIRWITLSIGLLLLLVNWHVPTDGEQGEYFGLMLCSMAGVLLTASANDLIAGCSLPSNWSACRPTRWLR